MADFQSHSLLHKAGAETLICPPVILNAPTNRIAMYPLLEAHDRHRSSRPQFREKLPQVQLHITRGRAVDRIRPVRRPTFFIGRGHECDLVLGDPQFADVHAYLMLNRQGVSVRHLGWGPELLVDGQAVRRAQLNNQSRIRTGTYEFLLEVGPLSAEVSWSSDPLGTDGGCLQGRDPGTSDAAIRQIELLLAKAPDSNSGQALSGLRLFEDQVRTGESPSIATILSIGVLSPSVQPPPWQHFSK